MYSTVSVRLQLVKLVFLLLLVEQPIVLNLVGPILARTATVAHVNLAMMKMREIIREIGMYFVWMRKGFEVLVLLHVTIKEEVRGFYKI